MINNKGYVFLPLILFFLLITTLTIVFFKQELSGSVNQALVIQGLMDRAYYNYSKRVITVVNDFKQLAYANLSNSSLVASFNESVGGVIVDNDPSLPFLVSEVSCSGEDVNTTFPLTQVFINISYPISDLLTASESFNPIVIQQCLDDNDCSDNREHFNQILIGCINWTLNGFDLRNSTVPLLVGDQVHVGLELVGGSVPFLFPFKLGRFSFTC
ncbi:hypothetical protein GF352_02775 [archaeon]|nr:hypothetical protein [archaeon]